MNGESLNNDSVNDDGEFTVQCRIKDEPAAMERVLRVVRVRGFRVIALNYTVHKNEYRGTITLRGTRSMDNLIQQLLKLEAVIFIQKNSAVLHETSSQEHCEPINGLYNVNVSPTEPKAYSVAL